MTAGTRDAPWSRLGGDRTGGNTDTQMGDRISQVAGRGLGRRGE